MNPRLQIIPTILRPELKHAAVQLGLRQVIILIIFAGAIYGAVMGSFGGCRLLQMLYSAIKVPCLLGVSFGLTVPSFFILCTLLGVREDFKPAMRAVTTAQAGLAIMLLALCPFVALWYGSCNVYAWAILFNGAMFAIATITGQILLRRFYQTLIARNSRHRRLMLIWTLAYAFTAIQMAWVLRPFVGGPKEATTFFRTEAWGNAYIAIANLIQH